MSVICVIWYKIFTVYQNYKGGAQPPPLVFATGTVFTSAILYPYFIYNSYSVFIININSGFLTVDCSREESEHSLTFMQSEHSLTYQI